MKRLICLLLLLLLGQAALAEEDGLSKKHRKLLRGIPTPVAVPTYVPDGFTAHKIVVSMTKHGELSYRILYTSRDRKGFVVESVASGIGHPKADKIIPLNNPVYGETFVGIYVFDGQKSISGDWIGEGPYFRVRDTDRRHKDEKRLDGGLTAETMGKIHASLRPLR